MPPYKPLTPNIAPTTTDENPVPPTSPQLPIKDLPAQYLGSLPLPSNQEELCHITGTSSLFPRLYYGKRPTDSPTNTNHPGYSRPPQGSVGHEVSQPLPLNSANAAQKALETFAMEEDPNQEQTDKEIEKYCTMLPPRPPQGGVRRTVPYSEFLSYAHTTKETSLPKTHGVENLADKNTASIVTSENVPSNDYPRPTSCL